MHNENLEFKLIDKLDKDTVTTTLKQRLTGCEACTRILQHENYANLAAEFTRNHHPHYAKTIEQQRHLAKLSERMNELKPATRKLNN